LSQGWNDSVNFFLDADQDDEKGDIPKQVSAQFASVEELALEAAEQRKRADELQAELNRERRRADALEKDALEKALWKACMCAQCSLPMC
jgi:hypothetical protein